MDTHENLKDLKFDKWRKKTAPIHVDALLVPKVNNHKSNLMTCLHKLILLKMPLRKCHNKDRVMSFLYGIPVESGKIA